MAPLQKRWSVDLRSLQGFMNKKNQATKQTNKFCNRE